MVSYVTVIIDFYAIVKNISFTLYSKIIKYEGAFIIIHAHNKTYDN